MLLYCLKKMEYGSFQKALWWYLLVAVAALFGSRFTNRKFYETLIKPSWSPRPWVFGVAWTIAYSLEAQASYWVQRETGTFGTECWVYLAFLVVSTLWTPIFFYYKMIFLSMAVILASLGLSIAVTILYWDVYAISGAFALVTTCWVAFASWLNWRICNLNSSGPPTVKKEETRTLYTSEMPFEFILSAQN